ncbi:Na+/H+ antiporter subunit G [Aeromicrobium sp. SMF47]|uniref:monovalent cation/H(+) antiporter subunit G n=1 Tax=Aeromicrobium yanjiei TaxID=2662028 RepID=UPI0013FC9A27|nr:Na+/H+ antiporter subunit G [Aeromicrobium yanjiei]
MSWTDVADAAAAVCFLLGALLGLIAAVGVLKLPDLLSRMHAATKPQVLGLLLMLLGLGLRLRDPGTIGLLVLIGLFQMLTTPVANHMVARASYRAGQLRVDDLVVNDLATDDYEGPSRGEP